MNRDEHDYEADTGLLRELKRRRADLEDDLKKQKKQAECLEFKEKTYKDFMRFLPELRYCVVKSKLEL